MGTSNNGPIRGMSVDLAWLAANAAGLYASTATAPQSDRLANEARMRDYAVANEARMRVEQDWHAQHAYYDPHAAV